jgi:hypothetical protein
VDLVSLVLALVVEFVLGFVRKLGKESTGVLDHRPHDLQLDIGLCCSFNSFLNLLVLEPVRRAALLLPTQVSLHRALDVFILKVLDGLFMKMRIVETPVLFHRIDRQSIVHCL